jgi:hypothetical protein
MSRAGQSGEFTGRRPGVTVLARRPYDLRHAGRAVLRSDGRLAGLVFGVVGQEVVDHAVEQGGELV